MLQERLRARGGGLAEVEVWNAGVPGYTTYQELRWFELFGQRLQADVVVLQFCLNDLHRILHEIDGHGRMRIAPAALDLFHGSALASLIRRSALLDLLVRRSFRLRELRARLLARDVDYSFEAAVDFHRAWRDEGWSETEPHLVELAQRVRASGAEFAIVVVPFGRQFDPDSLARNEDYVRKPQWKLAAIAHSLGVPLLDLFSVLRLQPERLYDEIHLDAEGNALVAQQLESFLRREGLIAALERAGSQEP
jgi:lysophospholipase L1-like esterase